MQVESTVNTASVYNTTTTRENNSESLSLFENLLAKEVVPKEISYDNYKKLSEEDIQKLFPEDAMPKEYAKAIALHTKANYSEDEILNQVLFDKELEFSDSEVDTYVSRSLDFMAKTWHILREPPVIDERHIGLMNIPPYTEPIPQETLDEIAADKIKCERWSKEDKIPADFLFSVFKNMKEEFIQNEEYYKNSTSTFRVHGRDVFAIHASIQQEYERRKDEQNSTLEAYTKNNKQTLII